MAKRDLIKKNKGEGYNPTSQEYKDLIQEFIRLDVPILEIGSSSIGKSYSIRQFMEESGVKGEFLFVGTEKSEFIEGIPNLKGVTEGQAKFSYLKPYWFPDKNEIRARLINGRNQLEELADSDSTIENLWSGASQNYQFLKQIKELLLGYKRTEAELKKSKKAGAKTGKYLYEDALLYISTIQGFGNFWLILDEIDKVEKQDKDKYAPLLHIVRERELKGWKLSGLREFPEYDVKFVESVGIRMARLDAALADPNADVTDTRIIAIANDLQVMEEESPALYRRFVKIVISRSLYDEKKATLPSGNSLDPVGYDWARAYEIKKQELHSCIVVKEIAEEQEVSDAKAKRSGVGTTKKGVTIAEQMAYIEPEKTGKPLEEMNLQWTLGFLPEILFPGNDVRGQGDMFVSNYIIENFNDEDNPYKTLMFKIIQDNFGENYWVPLLECVYDKVSSKKESASSKATGIDAEVAEFFADAGLATKANYSSPNVANVEKMLDRYAKKLAIAESKYAEALDIQKGKQTGKTTAGVEGAVTVIGTNAVAFGNVMLSMSLDGNKPTELTKLLVSAVPFLQIRFISSSPYISFDIAKDLMEVHNSGMVNLIYQITGKSFKNEAEAKEATGKVFSTIPPYRPFIVKYGLAVPQEYIEPIAASDYSKIRGNASDVIQKIIANRPAMIDQFIVGLLGLGATDQKLKREYMESVAPVKMIEKEVYQNLAYEIWPMIVNSYDADGLTPVLKAEIQDYADKFPNRLRVLAEGLARMSFSKEELKDFVDEAADKSTNATEIDSLLKM